VAADKIFQIEYTTDLDRFTCLDPQRSEEAAKRLLYVGQLVERKGLVPFLRVLAKWAEAHPVQSVEFLVVGSGPLAETIKALPQPRNVKLVVCKAKGYEDLPDIYKAAGIFVLPTLADTWAVVVNEAMASAVPIMGSLCSQAVGQMVEDGKTGWTFQPANEQEIYSAIDRAMMCSPEQLQQMRLAARQRALQITPADVADMIGKGLA
jgi:glycosyltransferase involved in cell wall biosynthesis